MLAGWSNVVGGWLIVLLGLAPPISACRRVPRLCIAGRWPVYRQGCGAWAMSELPAIGVSLRDVLARMTRVLLVGFRV
jgi:hypothetical protein